METIPEPNYHVIRSTGAAKRHTCDGIATHCGFVEQADHFFTYARHIAAACDSFFAARGMVWVPWLGDYRGIQK